MGALIQDVLFAFRTLRRSPGSTAVIVLTLSLGIGANTAIFSVVHAVLIRPLPYPESDRLMQVVRVFPEGEQAPAVSVPKFVHWDDHNHVFQRLTAHDILPVGVNISGGGRPERLSAIRVTADFFSVFGIQPALGRAFLDEEDRPEAARAIILSHGLWMRRFGGDPSWVGEPLTLDGIPFTVVGVMPKGFSFFPDADVWTPLPIDRSSGDRAHFLLVTGRLKDGVDIERARAEMRILGEQFIAEQGGIPSQERESVNILPLQEYLYGDFRPAFLLLLGAVALVLLIACANVANVKLARAAARQREIAVRTSLGAGTARIIRQLLTESMVLSTLGGLMALWFCSWFMEPLLMSAPFDLPALSRVSVNGVVLAFALGIAVLTGILTGLAPALHVARGDAHLSLREGSSRAAAGWRGQRTRKYLVAGELALTLLVAVTAALLTRSYVRLMETDPGFDPGNVLTMKLSLARSEYGNPVRLENLCRGLIPSIESLPGVRTAAVAVSLPLELGWDLPFIIEGKYVEGTGEGWGGAHYRPVSPGFFESLGITVLQGRTFEDSDTSQSTAVVIINDAVARRYWPNKNPIGRQITIGPPEFPGVAPPRVVVGVVGDVKERGLENQPPAILYVPISQLPERWAEGLDLVSLVVKGDRNLENLAGALEEEIWTHDADLPVMNIRTMDERVARSVGAREFNLKLIDLFAGLAVVLAAVGIYGVLSYIVSQRTHEIGIRMAIGARRKDVLRMVVGELMPAVGAGLALGILGALAVNRLISSMLFGVSGADPISLVGVSLGLGAVAMAAVYIPARRATKVSPIVALRYE